MAPDFLSLPDTPTRCATAKKEIIMTTQASTQNNNPSGSAEPHTFSTGGLLGALILWGVVLAVCGSGTTGTETATAASPGVGGKAVAVQSPPLARLEDRAVNQRSSMQVSDLRGTAIASNGK
jgi:hypothetical protein